MRKKRLKPEKWHSYQEKSNLSIYTHLKLCRMKSMLPVIHPYKPCLPLVRSEEAFFLQNLSANMFYYETWQMCRTQQKLQKPPWLEPLFSFFLFLENRMNEMVTDDTFIYVNMSLRIILRGEASECCVASASFTQEDREIINERGMSSVLAQDADTSVWPLVFL